MRRALTSVALFGAMVLLPVLAHGQAGRSGPTFSLGGTTSPVEQPDVAHDSNNNRYLQVAGKGFIDARLLDAAGGILAAFRVNATGEYSQSPRVAFSPNVPGGGGYLVTWHATLGNFTRVRGRIIRVDGAAATSDFDIATSAGSGPTSSNWTMGAAVAYATGSQEFLVAWMGNYGSTNDIFFQRVSNAGGLLGPNTLVSAGTADWDRDPSVAYNPNYDEFYVAYAGYVDAGKYGFAAGRRIKAGTGQIVSGIAQFGAAVSTYVPAVTYNTAAQQYLLAWYNRSASSAAVYGVTLDAAGALIGGIRALSPVYAAYDALDVDYNAPSGQYLLVTHGGGATPWEDAAVSILANGSAYDNGFIVTSTTDVRGLKSNPASNDGNFNPRLTASTSEKKWLLVTSSLFSATHAQFAASNASGGPVPVAPVAPVAPAGSDPRMSLDSPYPNTTVSGQFAIGGWAVDLGATSGVGIVAVHAWAFPTSGGGATFLGAATLGGARADVAGHFGRSQFSTSGFNLAGSLPPGTYDVRVSALSAVAGGFNNAATVRITVAAPPSMPKMWLDAPAQNQTITQFFTVVGWALDLGASLGTGVDGVHVWAYPVGGGNPVWAGAGSLGHSRPDVAGAFGAARFGGAGFFVTASLPPGEYNLVVYVHSSVTGTFNQAMVLRIRVV